VIDFLYQNGQLVPYQGRQGAPVWAEDKGRYKEKRLKGLEMEKGQTTEKYSYYGNWDPIDIEEKDIKDGEKMGCRGY